MKEKLFMYPGYDDEHNLKAVELDSTIIFGFTGKGKTTVLTNMLQDIEVHNPEREVDYKYVDARRMEPEDFVLYLNSIIDMIELRYKFLKDERYSKSIPMLIREGVQIPFREMVIGIDNCYTGNIDITSELNKILEYIIIHGKVAGITIIMTTMSSESVSVSLLNLFQYRICLPVDEATANRVIYPNSAEKFSTLDRVLLFREKCAIIHPYLVLGVTGERADYCEELDK